MFRSKNPIKICLLAAVCLVMGLTTGGTLAQAKATPPSYNYSYWGETIASPAAYQATNLISGVKLGVGAFDEPNDIHVTSDQTIYVLDSGNNRVIVMDQDWRLIRIIDSFVQKGQTEGFSKPLGLFVTDEKELYIADTGNKRLVHLDQDLNLVKIIQSPQSELFASNFEFLPTRVVVDKAKRIYVMATGVFDGFMEFNADGGFISFLGANRVNVNPVDYFWKMISTEAQRSQMVMYTPTEFTNLDINEDGFIYATNGDTFGDTIKKFNARGSDILRREGYFNPRGDVRYHMDDGPSRLVDIDVTDSEIYSVLDSKKGRIFTYNGDGFLMYIFGGIGNRLGEFNTPVAIERANDSILVLDRALGEITVFETTEYGRTLNEAVKSYFRGNEEQAFPLYMETINKNANLEFVYSGIGKSLLRQGKYQESLKYFDESMDRKNYSKAFLLYRKEVLREHFASIMTGIVLLIGCFLAIRWYRYMKWRRRVHFVEN